MLTPKRYHLDVAGGLNQLLTDLPMEVIVLHSPGGQIHFASHSSPEIFGEGADLSHSNFIDMVHADDRERVRKTFIDVAMRKEKVSPMTVRITARPDLLKWVVLYTIAVRDGAGQVIELHSTLRDVTEQVGLRDRIVEHDTLSHITNVLAKVGGWYHDLGTPQLFWSKEVCRIHEVDDDFVTTNDSVKMFYEPRDLEAFAEVGRAVIESGIPEVVEMAMTTAKGNKRWIRVFVSASYDKGTPVRLYGATQDISEIREREMEQERLVKELTLQRNLMEEFGQLVSHQLRSPLTNLATIGEMLHEATDDEERWKLLQALKESVISMNRTLDEVSEAVQVRHSVVPRDERIAVASMVHEISSALSQSISDIGARIQVDTEQLPYVDYPPIYLEAVLRQLITNALRFAHPDRPLVVHVSTGFCDGDPAITISDNGMGMDLGRHGKRLFKLGSTFHRQSSGRGVGLFMVRSIVESLGGEILVESEPDRGTTFTINLRKYRAEEP